MKAKALAKAVLPASLRRALRQLDNRVRRRQLASVDQLDAEILRAERAFRVSEDEGRRALTRFCLAPPRDLPRDPDSGAYREAQMELYRRISGRPAYTLENEHSTFDVEEAVASPFPYQTRSFCVVADQLLGQAFLLRALGGIPAGANILEFGPGWGSTTLHLLKLGHRVTAVEIDPKFCEVVRRRGISHASALTLVHGDMLAFSSSEKFDAVVFFESFHHCLDHVQLLRNVRTLLRPGGRLVLAAEPVADFPYPWGVRLDGESLWAMRRHGWLELGFDTSYFLALLKREGFRYERAFEPAIGHLSQVITAYPSPRGCLCSS